MEQEKNRTIPTNFVGQEETEEPEEDALSLCDLASTTLEAFEDFPSPVPVEAFQFFADQMEETILSIDSILFCGRSIPFDKPRNFRAYQEQRSPLSLLRSDSFKRQQLSLSLRRSNSFRSSLTTSKDSPTAAGSSRRKYKAIIGVTKFPSKMEMSDIKKRQSRRAPAPLVPAAFDGGEEVVAVATSRGGGNHHWGLLRPLRCRSQLVNVFGRASLGCIPHV